MEPILPLSVIKRKKVAPLQHPYNGKAQTQAPLEVVQEEPESASSASSIYSLDLSHSSTSPRSSCDSKRSVRTNGTSPAPSLKVSIPEAPPTKKPTIMPSGTSFLHMDPPTPISNSPTFGTNPKPGRPPRNPLRQQRKPIPTAPLPPTPKFDDDSSHSIAAPALKVVPEVPTPPLRLRRSLGAALPHYASFSSSSYHDTSRNTSTISLPSTSQTTGNTALTPFEKRAAPQVLTSRGRSDLKSKTSDAPPVFVYAFLSDSIILSLLFTRDLRKDVQKQPARIVSNYELTVLEGGRSNYPLLSQSSSPETSGVDGYLVYGLSKHDRRKIQDFPFHPHWRRSSTPETSYPLFDMIEVEVDDGTGNLIKATTVAWRKDVSRLTGLQLLAKSWDVEKGRKACVAAYLSIYCSPEKSAERLKKKIQRSQVKSKDDALVPLRNVKSFA